MKNLFKYLLITTLAVAFSCNESEDVVTANAREGGLLNITNTSVNYVIGEPVGPYTLEFYVRQGDVKTTEVRLYKSFVKTERWTETIDGEDVDFDTTFVSNEILEETFTITDTNPHYISVGYGLDELAAGLEVASRTAGPEPVPTDDTQFSIGDRWVFRIESTLEDGRIVEQSSQVSVSVSTRYAGTYRAVFGEYYRLGVITYVTSDWPDEIIIESVDATTYRMVNYWGPFEPNELLFEINEGVITWLPGQKINDVDLTTCESNPADYGPEMHCGNTNYVINDDEGGKDRLVMTNGYNTPGSGPRVMYQVLEKIVN